MNNAFDADDNDELSVYMADYYIATQRRTADNNCSAPRTLAHGVSTSPILRHRHHTETGGVYLCVRLGSDGRHRLMCLFDIVLWGWQRCVNLSRMQCLR